MISMKRDGDDILYPPLLDDILIESVIVRIERARSLRSLMITDRLTGLFNHTALMERLDTSMENARQRNRSLSFAMIDIDRFRSVNDRYGLATGDTVIKNLARLLRHRLGDRALIGRYGGEEFGVILRDLAAGEAADLLDSAREAFSKVRQSFYREDFYVSFSCGIASSGEFAETSQITQAADQRLYAAKEAGRNKVVAENRISPD